MAELDRLVDYTPARQALSPPREPGIAIESKQPVSAELTGGDIAAAYRSTIRVSLLFGGFGEEGRRSGFLLLRIPGVSVGELPESPFALAHDLVYRLHLVSVGPDLSTDLSWTSHGR